MQLYIFKVAQQALSTTRAVVTFKSKERRALAVGDPGVTRVWPDYSEVLLSSL